MLRGVDKSAYGRIVKDTLGSILKSTKAANEGVLRDRWYRNRGVGAAKSKCSSRNSKMTFLSECVLSGNSIAFWEKLFLLATWSVLTDTIFFLGKLYVLENNVSTLQFPKTFVSWKTATS